MKISNIIFLAIMFILGLWWVGSQDVKEAQRQQSEYCHKVGQHIWSDYNGNYKELCK